VAEQLALLSLATSIRKPVEPIARGATIEGDYRYDLTRAWGAGPAVAFCMLNPSTADGKTDDPTIRNIMQRSLLWGFSSLVVVNIYPYRTSDPAAMKKWRNNRSSWDAIQVNADRAWAHIRRCEMTIAAWGAHADSEDVEYLLDHPNYEPEWAKPVDLHCLGLTKSGAPLHPLARGKHFVPIDRKPIPFKFEPADDYH
jgi:hypothetical protein